MYGVGRSETFQTLSHVLTVNVYVVSPPTPLTVPLKAPSELIDIPVGKLPDVTVKLILPELEVACIAAILQSPLDKLAL